MNSLIREMFNRAEDDEEIVNYFGDEATMEKEWKAFMFFFRSGEFVKFQNDLKELGLQANKLKELYAQITPKHRYALAPKVHYTNKEKEEQKLARRYDKNSSYASMLMTLPVYVGQAEDEEERKKLLLDTLKGKSDGRFIFYLRTKQEGKFGLVRKGSVDTFRRNFYVYDFCLPRFLEGKKFKQIEVLDVIEYEERRPHFASILEGLYEKRKSNKFLDLFIKSYLIVFANRMMEQSPLIKGWVLQSLACEVLPYKGLAKNIALDEMSFTSHLDVTHFEKPDLKRGANSKWVERPKGSRVRLGEAIGDWRRVKIKQKPIHTLADELIRLDFLGGKTP